MKATQLPDDYNSIVGLNESKCIIYGRSSDYTSSSPLELANNSATQYDAWVGCSSKDQARR